MVAPFPPLFVIPAKAGIQGQRTSLTLGPRFRGDDDGRCDD
jgi:hypothetical protein